MAGEASVAVARADREQVVAGPERAAVEATLRRIS